MAFEEILRKTESILEERGVGGSWRISIALMREDESLTEDTLRKRSFGKDDDMAMALCLADELEVGELRKRVGFASGKLFSHKRHLVDAWAVCETLRRMGFRPEQMSVSAMKKPGYGSIVYVRLQSGGKEFMTVVSTTHVPVEDAMDGWDDLWRDVVVAGEDELSVFYARSMMGDLGRCLALAEHLEKNGIKRLSPEDLSVSLGLPPPEGTFRA